MTRAVDNEIGWEILQLLGVKDSHIVEATIHIKVNDITTIDIKRFATREDGKLILNKEKTDIKTILKRYRLEEIKEKRAVFETDYR